MAHFAELDENNKVINLIVVDNNELLDDNGVELENKGINFCVNLFGGTWVQTSYNATIRKHYAGIGFTYDAALDAFIPPKCHDEAQLDTTTCLWKCDNDGHKL
jgi:hypothetical protein